MNEKLRCANKEPHDVHMYEADVHYHCSGSAECGKLEHEPHMFVMENVPVRCPGICGCTDAILHSPAEHK